MRKWPMFQGLSTMEWQLRSLLFKHRKTTGVYGCASPLSKRMRLCFMLLAKKKKNDIFFYLKYEWDFFFIGNRSKLKTTTKHSTSKWIMVPLPREPKLKSTHCYLGQSQGTNRFAFLRVDVLYKQQHGILFPWRLSCLVWVKSFCQYFQCFLYQKAVHICNRQPTSFIFLT